MSQNQPYHSTAGHAPAPQPDHTFLSGASSSGAPASAQPTLQSSAADMSVLKSLSPEQLAVVYRLIQSGALQPPPDAVEPAQVSAAAPSASVDSGPLPSHPQPQLITMAIADDMDTEEGEVNESESDHTAAKRRDFLRPPPTGPKNRSVSPRDIKQRRSSPRPPRPISGGSRQSESALSQTSQIAAATNHDRVTSKNEAAKMFILEMAKAGYSYADILPEVRHPKSLIRMFIALNLPVDPTSITNQSSEPSISAKAHSKAQAPFTNLSSVEEAPKASLPKPQPPAKPAPVSRADYLARLQAARTKKADTDTKPESDTRSNDAPSRSQPVETKKNGMDEDQPLTSQALPQIESASNVTPSNVISVKAQQSGPDGIVSSASQPASSSKAARDELLKKKLQALRAQQAARQGHNAMSNPDAPTLAAPDSQITASLQNGLGAGIAEIPNKITQKQTQPPPPLQSVQQHTVAPSHNESAASPTPQTPSIPFGSLPGLFMSSATSQPQVIDLPWQSGSAVEPPVQSLASVYDLQRSANTARVDTDAITATPATVSASRKRPVASDFDDTYTRPTPSKRPFGQSRNASEDESLVIEVSDAEDEDDDTEPLMWTSSKTGLQTKSFRDVAPLRDFPSKPNFPAQTSSPGTPGGITYEQKIKEIEEFKRKIAEKEARQKTNGKVPIHSDVTDTSIGLGEPNAPYPNDQSDSPTDSSARVVEPPAADSIVNVQPQPDTDLPSRGLLTERRESATKVAKQQEKERLRQRLLELENEEVDDDDALEDEEYEGTGEALQHLVADAEPAALDTPPVVLRSPSHTTEQPMELNSERMLQDDEDQGSASEEGELTDGSMSNFYDLQDATRDEIQDTPLLQDTNGYSNPMTPSTASEIEGLAASGVHLDLSSGSAPTLMTAAEFENVDVDAEQLEVETNDDIPLNNAPSRNTSTADAVDVAEHLEVQGDDIINSIDRPSNIVNDGAASQNKDVEEQQSDEPSSDSMELSAGPDQPDSEANSPISNTAYSLSGDVGMTDDDLAPELQNNPDENHDLAPEPQQNLDIDSVNSIQNLTQPRHVFTPYRSPLQGFKDYRYHPDYLDTIPGGHKSATYSYNIDPERSFCPYETAGGKCNDSSCEYQHFKSLVVSDTELLKMMGTKRIPANSPEELKRWNEGLGHVVRELRNTNLGKDAYAIAARIAEFRRNFIGDSTKILNLG